MLICHNCGTPIENKVRQCHHCQNSVSAYAAVSVSESTISQPAKIEFETQPTILNQLTAKELIKSAYLAGHRSSNGNGNGHGHSAKDNKESHNNKNSAVKDATITETLNGTDTYFLSLPDSKSPLSPKFNLEGPNKDKTVPAPDSESLKNIGKQADFFAELPNITQDNDLAQSPLNREQFSPPSAGINLLPETDIEPSKINSSILFPEEFKPEDEIKIVPSQSLNSQQPQINEKEPFDINSIHRRSFSGDFSGISSNKSQTNQNKNIDLNNIFNRIKTSVKDALTVDPKTGKSRLIGLKPWQIYLSVALALFILYKGFEAFCGISSAFIGNTSNIFAQQNNALSGRWQFAAKWNTGACNGQLVLHQSGNQVFGQGADQYGNYKFNGTRTNNHLDFLKQYFVGNSFTGHPIELHGDIDISSKPLFISGKFTKQYVEGGKWRGKPVILVGDWEAEMIQPLIEDGSANGFSPVKPPGTEGHGWGDFFKNLSKNGLWLAACIIGGGIFLYYGAGKLFGPDGLMGVWDKQKYIPPHFDTEHRKERTQLSRPVTIGSLPLGQRWEWHFWHKPFFWIPRYLAIPPDIRANNPHVLVLGGGEKGKSRLMAQMIAADIESGDRAIVLVDSDGDLADLTLRWIASHEKGEEISKRVLVIDPTTNLPSPSFNPLEAPDDQDLQNAASSIVHGFKAMYHEPPGSQNQWSPQTAHILRNCAMLLMANNKTLIDLPTLLQDNDFRDILLEKVEQKRKERVEYATLLETWGQYKRLARTEQWISWYEPILNRVGPTLINQRIRPVLTQSKGDINLKQVIAEKKILIVKIPKGQLHEDANLLGALIVTGMKQAAISLCSEGKSTDRTAAMYLDEFDHFIEKETLDAITTETKKFQLGFIGATKTLQHLPEDFRNQIVINIGTMCVFALSKKDGDMLGPQMFRVSGRKAKHRTIMNLFNPMNTSPQFELISDEEKYNIDRILGQGEKQYYAYRVGTEAGTFRLRCHEFSDVPEEKVNPTLVNLMYKNR